LVLFRIDQELSGVELEYVAKDVHLDSIAPPPPTQGFQKWIEAFFPLETENIELEYSTTVNQWGNIALVKKPLPLSARGASFKEKVDGTGDYEGFSKSEFSTTKNLSLLDDWSRSLIKDRNTWIGKCVLAIWPPGEIDKNLKHFLA
jgi:hypothetical protein